MRRALYVRVGAMVCSAALACARDRGSVGGAATPVPGAGLPSGHPPVGSVEAPTTGAFEHTGRARRRLSATQLRAALVGATGFGWVGRRTVADPDAPRGFSEVDDADFIAAVAGTLGEPDFRIAVRENLEASVPFSKLAGDAARAACAAAVRAEVAGVPEASRHLLVRVGPTDTLATNGPGVRENIAALALTFWGRQVPPEAPEFARLVRLFESVSTAPAGASPGRSAGTPGDGWRAVCIAMATDPQFLTY